MSVATPQRRAGRAGRPCPALLLVLLLLVVLVAGCSSQDAAGDTPTTTQVAGDASTTLSTHPPGDAPSPDGSGVMRKGPYLVYTGDATQMTVMWQTWKTAKEATLEWGPDSRYGHGPERVAESGSGTDGHLHRFDITGLDPGSLVYYRATVDGVSAAGTFRAAPGADAASSVLYALGDTQDRPQTFERVIGALLTDASVSPETRTSICLHAGDFVASGTVESAWDEEFFIQASPVVGRFLANMPVMAALGNHEGYGELGTARDPALRGVMLRKYWPGLFSMEPPRFYYSFDYGPVHVSVLDVYTAGLASGTEQYDWFAQDLLSTDRPWKIVMFHNPAWSAGKGQDNFKSIRESIGGLIQALGAQVVLQGHNHYYARCDVNGVQFLTVGGGGGELDWPDPAAPNVVVTAKAHHFIRIEATSKILAVTAIADDGRVLDSFSLRGSSVD